jgi:hypothetical protein
MLLVGFTHELSSQALAAKRHVEWLRREYLRTKIGFVRMMIAIDTNAE